MAYVRTGEIPNEVAETQPYGPDFLIESLEGQEAEDDDVRAAFIRQVLETGEIGLAEHQRYELMMRNWLQACQGSDPKAAFQSLYNVLIHIESRGNDGFLNLNQHSALLKLAVFSAENSSLSPAQRFVALYSLTRFVGPPQNKLLDDPIGKCMQKALTEMQPGEFADICEMLYLLPNEWDIALAEDTVAENVFQDFDAAPNGRAQEEALTMVARHLREHTNLAAGMAEDRGTDFAKEVIYSMENAGFIREEEATKWASGLLEYSPKALEEGAPAHRQG